MASNLYTVDISMNINTGCFVCEDETMKKTHGLCCDLVAELQSNFCQILPLYSKRYYTCDQEKLQDIVIKNVVQMLHESKFDDKNPISRYKFCQLDKHDLRIVAEMTVSEFERTGETKMNIRMNTIEDRENEIFDTLKLLQTRFNTQTRINSRDKIESWQARTQRSQAAYERNMNFLQNIKLKNSYTVCFE